MNEKLELLLGAELKRRDWSRQQLANYAGVPYKTLNEIMSGQKRATFDVCKKLAAALNQSVEMVLHTAELLPAEPPSLEELELRCLLPQLTDEEREILIEKAKELAG